MRLLAPVLVLVVSGCPKDQPPNDNRTGDRAAPGDTFVGGDPTLLGDPAGTGDPNPQTPPDEVDHTIDACRDVVDEPCFWKLRFDPTLCNAASPCDKLVVFFSGGDMSCDDDALPAAYEDIVSAYTSDGFVFICAGIFLTKAAAGMQPYAAEASRVGEIMTTIAADPDLAVVWTGERLLISGASHGATAPVIAMASTSMDDYLAWQGSSTSAACFFDASYDAAALDAFLLANSDCHAFRERAICDRYVSDPTDHATCTTHTALAPQTPALLSDVIVDEPADVFAISSWKLIECGSALSPKCGLLGWDMFPAESMETLCDTLNASAQHSCAWDPMPSNAHLTCPGLAAGIDRCRLWFDGL
jgi:hypothetical protein